MPDAKFAGNTPASWFSEDVVITANCQKYDHIANSWANRAKQNNYGVGKYGVKNGVNGMGYRVNSPTDLQKYNPATNAWSATAAPYGQVGQSIPNNGGAFSA